MGTDGTVVGAYGGSNLYTLEADGIRIKEFPPWSISKRWYI